MDPTLSQHQLRVHDLSLTPRKLIRPTKFALVVGEPYYIPRNVGIVYCMERGRPDLVRHIERALEDSLHPAGMNRGVLDVDNYGCRSYTQAQQDLLASQSLNPNRVARRPVIWGLSVRHPQFRSLSIADAVYVLNMLGTTLRCLQSREMVDVTTMDRHISELLEMHNLLTDAMCYNTFQYSVQGPRLNLSIRFEKSREYLRYCYALDDMHDPGRFRIAETYSRMAELLLNNPDDSYGPVKGQYIHVRPKNQKRVRHG